MKKNYSNVFWGIALILVGIGYGGQTLNLWDFNIFFPGWWTLFIILPSLFSMFEQRLNVFNTFGLILGILLLLDSIDIINNVSIYKLVFPLIIILIGFSLLFSKKNNFNKKKMNKDSINGNGKIVKAYGILSGQTIKPLNQEFSGANTVSILGGVDIDLRMAIIKEDILITAVVILGGTDIFLPPNVNVVVSGIPVLGDIENRVNLCPIENAPTVYIDAVCVLGGLDIK